MSKDSSPLSPASPLTRRDASGASRKRVVVTGLGAVTPLGNSAPDSWRAMVAGVSGAAPITHFDASAFGTHFACELKGFDALQHMDRKQAKRLDPFCHYALAAAGEAIRDAGIPTETLTDAQRARIGVIFGSGIGGIGTFQEQVTSFVKGGPNRISPFFIPMLIPDMAAGIISIEHGFRGPNHSVVTACATGNHNIGDALSSIQRDEADMIVCGGSEAPITEMGLGGFGNMKALSTRNDDPATASRPFDKERDGFVVGEGAGALVMESLEHALARGARVYAEVMGVGASADAYHITAPHPEGLGARLAMERALTDAGLSITDIDTINMHGTSTPLGDIAESKAIRDLFGEHADRLVATSTKSMTGHTLGAAGAIEALASIMSIIDGTVPPTINHRTPDDACDLRYAFNEPVRMPIRVAMSNAFGFGGHNTSAIFARYDG